MLGRLCTSAHVPYNESPDECVLHSTRLTRRCPPSRLIDLQRIIEVALQMADRIGEMRFSFHSTRAGRARIVTDLTVRARLVHTRCTQRGSYWTSGRTTRFFAVEMIHTADGFRCAGPRAFCEIEEIAIRPRGVCRLRRAG